MRAAWVALGLAATFATTGCASNEALTAEARCPWPEPVVATAETKVPVHLFADIDTTWTLARLFARLGPARRELGAGSYTYEWVADDGRVFVASAASRCSLVRKAQFEEAPPDS